MNLRINILATNYDNPLGPIDTLFRHFDKAIVVSFWVIRNPMGNLQFTSHFITVAIRSSVID